MPACALRRRGGGGPRSGPRPSEEGRHRHHRRHAHRLPEAISGPLRTTRRAAVVRHRPDRRRPTPSMFLAHPYRDERVRPPLVVQAGVMLAAWARSLSTSIRPTKKVRSGDGEVSDSLLGSIVIARTRTLRLSLTADEPAISQCRMSRCDGHAAVRSRPRSEGFHPLRQLDDSTGCGVMRGDLRYLRRRCWADGRRRRRRCCGHAVRSRTAWYASTMKGRLTARSWITAHTRTHTMIQESSASASSTTATSPRERHLLITVDGKSLDLVGALYRDERRLHRQRRRRLFLLCERRKRSSPKTACATCSPSARGERVTITLPSAAGSKRAVGSNDCTSSRKPKTRPRRPGRRRRSCSWLSCLWGSGFQRRDDRPPGRGVRLRRHARQLGAPPTTEASTAATQTPSRRSGLVRTSYDLEQPKLVPYAMPGFRILGFRISILNRPPAVDAEPLKEWRHLVSRGNFVFGADGPVKEQKLANCRLRPLLRDPDTGHRRRRAGPTSSPCACANAKSFYKEDIIPRPRRALSPFRSTEKGSRVPILGCTSAP